MLFRSGRRERRQREEDLFRRNLQTEQEKRLEQQRKDRLKEFEEQLAFSKEKSTLDEKWRALQEAHAKIQDESHRWSIKRVGLDMIAKGLLPGKFTESPPETIRRGLDEFQNRRVMEYGRWGEGDIIENAPQKLPIELAPGVTLENWQTPEEYGRARLAAEGPLLKKKEEFRQAAAKDLLDRQIAQWGAITDRMGKQNEAIAGRQIEADKRRDASQEARDKRQFEHDEKMARLKAELEQDKSTTGGASLKTKIASHNALISAIDNVIKKGKETNWSIHNWSNIFPWQNMLTAASGSDTEAEKDYRAALNIMTGFVRHDIMGATFTENEKAIIRDMLAESWNNPTVAEARLRALRDFYTFQKDALQKFSEPPAPVKLLARPLTPMDELRKEYAPK
mgnify:CR=1 FL=1